jgi:hypothetical protein
MKAGNSTLLLSSVVCVLMVPVATLSAANRFKVPWRLHVLLRPESPGTAKVLYPTAVFQVDQTKPEGEDLPGHL